MKQATSNNSAADWLDWLKCFKDYRYELSKEESLALRDAIMEYEPVAAEFFYETLRPLVLGMVCDIRLKYCVDVPPKHIATIIYCGIYEYNKFTRIRSYRGDCSFFSWCSMCASQIVVPELIHEGIIKVATEKETSQISLTLKSMKYSDELEEVLSLVEIEPLHSLLQDIYVKRMDDDQMKAKYNLDDKLLKQSRMAAENLLKEELVNAGTIVWSRIDPKDKKEDGRKVNLVTLALGYRENGLNTVSSDEIFKQLGETITDSDRYSFLADLLEHEYKGDTLYDKWNSFVLARASEMWAKTDKNGKRLFSVEDEVIWSSRYVEDESPTVLAKRLGRDVNWLNTRFNRLNVKYLSKYIQEWLAKR